MAVWWALARSSLRRRRGALVGLSLALALGLGVALAAVEAAARTQDAYPSYLRRAEAGELVVNPNLNTARAEEIIASAPGVESYVSDSWLTATPDRGAPRTQVEASNAGTQVRLSTDGRYVKQDRPVVQEGRMVRHGREAFVNAEMAKARNLRVGDTLPLAFWATNFFGPGQEPQRLVESVGRTEARVVGIGVFADEVLVDGLYPRQRVLVTPEVAGPFDCRVAQPSPDDARPLAEIVASIVPPSCATSYRYFSLRVRGGDDGVAALTDALSARFAEETGRLPAAMTAEDIGYYLVPTVTADERQRVQRSLDPAVRALQLFGAAAALSTLVVAVLGAARVARREEADAQVWRALGATRLLRTAAVALPLAAAAAAGLAGSLVVGWLASGIGPVASARAVESGSRLGLSATVALVVLAGSAAVLAGGIGLVAAASSRPTPEAATGPSPRPTRPVVPTANPSLTLGVRAAVTRAGGRALLAAAAVAVTAVLATIVFSASLGGLVSHPDRFGWPYDLAATIDFGYGGTAQPAAIAATLERPEVRQWGLASITQALTIKGQSVPSVAARRGFAAMRLPVIAGRLPTADDEIALGTRSAESLGSDVGDKVLVKSPYGDRMATIRGLVVLPPIGPLQSERAGLGTGVLLSARFYEALVTPAEQQAGMPPGSLTEGLTGFVAVDLRPGVDPRRFLAAISDQLRSWDANGARPLVYPEPVRPPTVANVAAMRAVPVALAGALALAMALGLFIAIAVTTRARRRELAVLRALGGVGRQLRASVRWQALTVVGIALVVGIPVGLALGRVSYRAFATGLGVVPRPEVSPPWVLLVGVATVGIGLVAAAGPGHRAARIPAAEVLRAE